MAIQLSTPVRNNRLDQIETTIGVSAKLEVFTGAMPVNCAAATTGTKLAEYDLASDWMANASGGAKVLAGLPLAIAGLASGTAGYFRIFDNAGTTCHLQGTCSLTGGGGDMTFDNTSITSGQNATITGFTLTDANA